MRRAVVVFFIVAACAIAVVYIYQQQRLASVATSIAVRNTSIYIPLLVDVSAKKYTGKIEGCDRVVMMQHAIPATTTPLTAALQLLFLRQDSWQPWNSIPGNYVAAQKDLNFVKAIIQRGEADIYLSGKIDSFQGECDNPRLRTELTQTALQFSSITSVQFFLNGKKTNLIFSLR